jgi:hypothetical protein
VRWLALVVLAACGAGAPRTQTVSNKTDSPATPITFQVRLDGVGPLDYRSKATHEALRTALPGLEVKAHDLGDVSGIVYDVLDGDDKLFYVVPDEEEQEEDGTRRYLETIFTIFVTSPRISVQGYSWRVGAPLESTKDLVRCECWGSGEVTACSIRAHLAVIFEERCEAAEKDGPQAMVGHKIGRIMWERVARD